MPRFRRQQPKQGLAEERRRLVDRYVTPEEEPPQAAAEVDAPAREPEPSAAIALDAPRQAPEPKPPTAVQGEQPRPRTAEGPAAPPASLPPVRRREAADEGEHDRFQPRAPAPFGGAIPMLEEVVRLCEQVALLGAECDRRREALAGAVGLSTAADAAQSPRP